MTQLINTNNTTVSVSAGRGPCNSSNFYYDIYSHFVLWEAVSQTKYCCSPKVNFMPSPILAWLRNWLGHIRLVMDHGRHPVNQPVYDFLKSVEKQQLEIK